MDKYYKAERIKQTLAKAPWEFQSLLIVCPQTALREWITAVDLSALRAEGYKVSYVSFQQVIEAFRKIEPGTIILVDDDMAPAHRTLLRQGIIDNPDMVGLAKLYMTRPDHLMPAVDSTTPDVLDVSPKVFGHH